MLTSMQSLWTRLTQPHPALEALEDRRGAQLAASILTPVLMIAAIPGIIHLFTDPDYFADERSLMYIFMVLGLALANVFIRTTNYRLGILAFIGTLIVYGAGAPILADVNQYVVFVVTIAPLLAAVFLELRAVMLVAIVTLICAIGVGTRYESMAITVGFIIAIQSIILLMFIGFRNMLERHRREELEAAVEQAESARQAVEEASKEQELLQQQVIEAQRRNLAELSSPVIPLMDGILLMPLIGTLDSHRAQDVMRSLLASISEHRAQAVLLDITGVPIMDTAVAKYLNQSIMAARLKGARCIVTGISDAVAETIVDLGIDWGKVETLRDLQSGLVVALRDAGYQLVAEDDDQSMDSLLASLAKAQANAKSAKAQKRA